MASKPPKRYQEVKEQFPEIIEAYEKLGKAIYDGPIPSKFVHLIKLAAAATTRSEGAMKYFFIAS